jgi:hypothetical protein
MPTIHHPYLLASGLIALAIGLLLIRWSGRHDIKGLAIDAAWTAAKSRGKTAMTPEIQARLDALKADASMVGRTRQVAGMAVRHFLSQIAGIASLVAIAAGVGLLAAGIWWK